MARPVSCRPLTGAWIETSSRPCRSATRRRRPLTGAWIETRTRGSLSRPIASRPLTGAWIETFRGGAARRGRPGRPLTGAWIETIMLKIKIIADPSRPLTGAWIETSASSRARNIGRVAPSQGRGSKRKRPKPRPPMCWSPPHRGVDRNRKDDDILLVFRRRPLTGAWIETLRSISASNSA